MKVKINISRNDFWNFNKYSYLNIPKFKRNFILEMICMPVLIFFLLYDKTIIMPFPLIILISIVSGAVGDLFLIYITKMQIMKMPLNKAGLLGEHIIEIDEKGVRETTSVNDGFTLWEGIDKVVQDKNYIYIFFDSILAHIIPKLSFKSINEANEFYNKSVEYFNKAKINN